MRVHSYSKSSIYSIAVKMTFACIALLIGLLIVIGRFASADERAGLIPEDAIRIRIIANSDSKSDQKIKSDIRDKVAAYIGSWGEMPGTHDEAYELIRSRLPAIQKRVDAWLAAYGVRYKGEVELAKVPFPEKVFEGNQYAAGEYEALRITLGKGEGANWWCVLFPPLCLTAAAAPDDAGAVKATAASGKTAAAGDDGSGDKPKAKFFLWELIRKLLAFLKSLFA